MSISRRSHGEFAAEPGDGVMRNRDAKLLQQFGNRAGRSILFAKPDDPLLEWKQHLEASFGRSLKGLNLRIEEIGELLQVAAHATGEQRALIQPPDKERTANATRR